MLNKVKSFIEKYGMLSGTRKVLAAVSGGADSMCLLTVLMELSGEYGVEVEAAHFNHRLRSAESDRDAEFTEEYCRKNGIPFHLGSGNVTAYAREHKRGIEESARIMRYDFFEETARKISADKTATAHTADDNAETVIMNLTRGAGLDGLCGIPPVRGGIIRPLLPVSRTEVEEYLKIHGIGHVEDSTNAKTDYTRNKVRHLVIPVLREINPKLCSGIFAGSEILRQDNEFIKAQTDKFILEKFRGKRVDRDELLALPEPVFARVVRRLTGAGEKHVAAVKSLCRSSDPSARVDIPGMTVLREYNCVVFGQEYGRAFEPLTLEIGQKCRIHELNIVVSCQKSIFKDKINKTFNTFLFKSESVCGKINIRPRADGDKLDLLGRNGTKTLKKLFIERHIPAWKREQIPVIADGKGVMAVYGIGQDRRTVPELGEDVLEVKFEGDILNA